MTDWKTTLITKLTSRKLWIAVAGFVTGIMVFRGASPESVESIGSLIMMGASVIGYLLAEGLVDSNRASTELNTEITIEGDGSIDD